MNGIYVIHEILKTEAQCVCMSTAEPDGLSTIRVEQNSVFVSVAAKTLPACAQIRPLHSHCKSTKSLIAIAYTCACN